MEESDVHPESPVIEELNIEGPSPGEINVNDAEETTLLQEGEEKEEDKDKEKTDEVLPEDQAYDPSLTIELGDRIIIEGQPYGRITGRVYYRSGDLIRVLPDGISNTLNDFPRIYTDDEDTFAEESGVTAAYILDKRKFDSFIEQQDIRVDQTLDAIQSGDDEVKGKYTVTAVYPDRDEITVKDEANVDSIILFNFTGIPTDLPFNILRKPIAPPSANEGEEGADKAEQSNKADQIIEEDEEGILEEEEEIHVVGVVELPHVDEYREAHTSEKVYTDTIQKIDALNDFLNMLDPLAQKDPKSIRIIRILVESMFQMKEALIARNDDGSIRGTNDISVQSISQLLNNSTVPLSRAVLNITKRIYTDENEDSVEDSTDEYFLTSFQHELDEAIKRTSTLTSTQISSSESIVKFWHDEQVFVNQFMRPWKPISSGGPTRVPKLDTDIFRYAIPDLEEEIGPIPGGFIPNDVNNLTKNYPILTNIGMSVQRSLGPTYRKGADRLKQGLHPAEAASMTSYLLFPVETANEIGTTRSGSLAIDSGRSLHTHTTLHDIIKNLEGVQDVTTARGILAIGVDGNTLGNIPITDYIKDIRIPGTGFGDADQTLVELGLDKLEMTPEILAALNTQFTMYQAQLISTLAMLRGQIDATESDEPVISVQFLEHFSILDDVIRSEAILAETLATFAKQNPSLAKSDIAQVAYLIRKHSDYFQAAAGQKTIITARERLRATRDMFIESIHIANLIKEARANHGTPPIANPCKHVSQLRTIRKIHDDMDRYQMLTKLFAKFQGRRDKNWIMCNVCDKDLFCVHERMQIQAFLSPREKDQLQKEIILNFADGAFQGHFICRNCGQPIQELGFDTHIEYDDGGKPMAGRATLVDKDALQKEEIEAALSMPIDITPELKFNNSIDNEYYSIIRIISEKIGVTLIKDAYMRIISLMSAVMTTLPSLKDYTGSEKKKLPYDKFVAMYKVFTSAIFLLVEIQSRIPDYVIKFALPGCVASFAGFPLGLDDDMRAMKYLSCAVAGITRTDAPWSSLSFIKERGDEKIGRIQKYMEGILKTALINDATLQHVLQNKRVYVKDIHAPEATVSRPADVIPNAFLPEQVILKSATDVIIPEVVARTGNSQALSNAWILHAHSLSQKTATLVRGMPFMEATCCLTNIEHPGGFWKSASDMPALPERQVRSGLIGQSTIKPRFKPRSIEPMSVTTPDDLLYRIFLKVCFQGPRKGMPHEPGLTNQCSSCGFQFPEHPRIMDTGSSGKDALVTQGVDISRDTFQALLDNVHAVNSIPKYNIPSLTTTDNTLNNLASMEFAPLVGWADIIRETIVELTKLPPNGNRGDVANALGSISTAIGDAEDIVNALMPVRARDALITIADISWTNFFQLVHAYFIIPFQRIVSNYDTKNILIPSELELSDDHFKDVERLLGNDANVAFIFGQKLAGRRFVYAKLAHFLKQMSAATQFKSSISAIMLPGRTQTLNYIQRAFLYGPIAELIDATRIPPGVEIVMGDKDIDLIQSLVDFSLLKAMRERLTFSDIELRELLEMRSEKEKIDIIKSFGTMTDDERAVEMTNKFLGLGRWAVGGTKRIWAYDPDQYDLEKSQRAAAGIEEDNTQIFGGLEVGVDANAGEGYDNNQHEADGDDS